jgi:transposase-like protein
MRYAKERKEAVLRKMLPPHNRSVVELAEEEGISAATLYLWRKQARAEGRLLPDGDSAPEGWSSADKFAAVLETAALNEAEFAEYCRKRGLYPEQVKRWRLACEQVRIPAEADHRFHGKATTDSAGRRPLIPVNATTPGLKGVGSDPTRDNQRYPGPHFSTLEDGSDASTEVIHAKDQRCSEIEV